MSSMSQIILFIILKKDVYFIQLNEPMVIDECAELWYYMDPDIRVPRGIAKRMLIICIYLINDYLGSKQ